MAYNREQFMNQITAIGTCEDDAQRRTMLAELQTETTTLWDNHDTLSTNVQNLTKDNENLRSANMKLFLQVGENKKPEDAPDGKKEEPPKKLKYEDLFNEEGGLK